MKFTEAQQIIVDKLSTIQLVDEPQGLYQPIAYTLESGGKRIRPSLCLMACDALGGNVEDAIYPALALEIFHNFTLLHDDLMDNDEVRRNRPTVHAKWDANIAILSGDAMQIIAYQYLAKCPAQYLKAIMDVFSHTALKVCEGQQYDMQFETQEDVTIDEYLKMIEYKTAILIECSLKIGAILAGADESTVNLFGEFGSNLGLAFQLRDDWLDTFGDFETFGKEIGSDVFNNKKTYLLISALQKAEGEQLSRLQYFMNDAKVSKEDKISGVKEIFYALEIDKLTQEQAEMHYQISITAIERIQMENRDDFISLAKKLLKRAS